MDFKKIEKVHSGKFIDRYDITYETTDHKEKVYEMISRGKNLTSHEDLEGSKVDAVVLIMHDPTGEKILINREFRLAVGKTVYGFPAGLIDPGETVYESAKRELKEETGLDLISITDELYESYSAVGFTNEKNIVVFGVADGNFAPSDSTFEEIEAAWYTKDEVRELLKNNHFAARTQMYCYMWVNR